MYTFKSRVRYSEIDKNGKLSLEALLNYFQDCSTFHSEDIGLGFTYLTECKRGWVLSAWQIVIDRYPDLCEKIVVGTAPYDFRGFLGYRNFLLQTEAGEQLACANSIWTLLDTEKGIPAKPSQEMISGYRLAEKLPMEYAARKIELTGTGTGLAPIPVRPHHLDTNNHVNNGRYIGMAKESFLLYEKSSGEPGEDPVIRQLRAEYRKSAVMGDTIYPVMMEDGSDRLTISLQDGSGNPYCNVELMRKAADDSIR